MYTTLEIFRPLSRLNIVPLLAISIRLCKVPPQRIRECHPNQHIYVSGNNNNKNNKRQKYLAKKNFFHPSPLATANGFVQSWPNPWSNHPWPVCSTHSSLDLHDRVSSSKRHLDRVSHFAQLICTRVRCPTQTDRHRPRYVRHPQQ